MSLATIQTAFMDPGLRQRVDAAVLKEAMYKGLADPYGRRVIEQSAFVNQTFYWRVAVDNEAAYEAALQANRGAPGHDLDIITDEAIIAAVQAAWPLPEEVEPSTVAEDVSTVGSETIEGPPRQPESEEV